MNKEAKVGLTIILGLLIVFVAVLGKKLYSSYAAGQSLVAQDTSEQKFVAPIGSEKEALLFVNKSSPARTASQPTVVTAANVEDKPPQSAANNDDRWSSVSDSDSAKISPEKVFDVKAPTSYMPEPPKSDVENQYDNISHSVRANRTYTVAEGDSLFDIARCALGRASRWAEIYDLNVDVLGKDIECLVPGTKIVLPEENIREIDPLTRRSRTVFRK